MSEDGAVVVTRVDERQRYEARIDGELAALADGIPTRHPDWSDLLHWSRTIVVAD